MGVEPRTLALLAPRSKPTELIDLIRWLPTIIDKYKSSYVLIDKQNHLEHAVQIMSPVE